MLGAAVAPTDAVAAVATFASVRVPERVQLLVQGESLINDATGLTAFQRRVVAAAAALLARRRAAGVRARRGRRLRVGIAVGWLSCGDPAPPDVTSRSS